MSYGDKPFGMNEIKLVRGESEVALPASRRMMFKERLISSEFKGDDALQAVASFSEAAEFEIEAGGLSLEAYGLMTGRTVTEAGTTPNRTNTLTGSGAQSYPYFTIYGKVLGDNGDDVHCKLFKCKLTEGLEGTFQHGEFMASKIKGLAIDDGTNGIYDFVQNETEDDLP